MLTREVAKQIVAEIMTKLGRNINIMNEQGVIIASGDTKRIGVVHEGALRVLKTGQALTIHEDHYLGARPGINLPITLNGDRVGVVGITGDPDEIAEFGALVVTMTELMLQRVALLDEMEWKERLKGFLLDECLKDDPDEQMIRHKAKLVDIEWRPPYALLVFHLKNSKEGIENQSNLYRKMLETLKKQDVIYDFVDDEHFVILAANAKTEWDIEKKLKLEFQTFYDEVRLGQDELFLDLGETGQRYARILKALELGDGDMIHTVDVSPLLLLDSTSLVEREKYIPIILNLPLELRKTLETFFKNDLNISQTAQSLFIHRNTMIYRLDRIADITGKDPRNFKDAWELQCGIWLFRTISHD